MSGGGRVDEDTDEQGFAPSRRQGTDEVHEERQVRPLPDREGLDKWLDDVLWGGLEVSGVTIPTMIPFALFSTAFVAKSALAFGFFTFVFVVGTLRGGWVDVGAPWPRTTEWLILLRVVYYNLAMVVIFFGGGFVAETSGVEILSAVAGTAFAVALGAAFPRLAAPFDPRVST